MWAVCVRVGKYYSHSIPSGPSRLTPPIPGDGCYDPLTLCLGLLLQLPQVAHHRVAHLAVKRVWDKLGSCPHQTQRLPQGLGAEEGRGKRGGGGRGRGGGGEGEVCSEQC